MRKLVCMLLVAVLCLSAFALAEKQSADSDAWVQVGAKTELRSEPKADAPAIKSIPKGSELDYLGKSSDGKWYHVAWKGKKGWIIARDGAVKWSTFY